MWTCVRCWCKTCFWSRLLYHFLQRTVAARVATSWILCVQPSRHHFTPHFSSFPTFHSLFLPLSPPLFFVHLLLLLSPLLLPTPSPVFPSPPPNQEDEDEAGGTALRGELEKLQVERNMLLETIEDLRQTVELTATLGEPDTKVSNIWDEAPATCWRSAFFVFCFPKRSRRIQTICLFLTF